MGEKTQGQKSKVIREFSAGGVVFKKTSKGTSYLIIQPVGTNRWQFPKGHLENGESSSAAAIREVREEGGVEARIIKKIGDTKYFFVQDGRKIFKIVALFLMQYESKSIDGVNQNEVDKVQLVPFDKAISILTFKRDKDILCKAKDILEASAS